MTYPAELPGIGSTAQRLRPNPRFDPFAAGMGPEEFFVWTRFDGATALRELLPMTGLPPARAVEVVLALRKVGAVLLPGETPDDVARPAAAAAPPVVRAPSAAPLSPPSPPPAANEAAPVEAGDAEALAEDVELGEAERRRVLALHASLGQATPAALLGVAPDADARVVKRAYFALSKEFHPDRYFGRRLGSFGPRLTAIFEELNRAYTALTDKPRRGAPDGASSSTRRPAAAPDGAAPIGAAPSAPAASGGPGPGVAAGGPDAAGASTEPRPAAGAPSDAGGPARAGEPARGPRTRVARTTEPGTTGNAEDLFQRACAAEQAGRLGAATMLFAAAVRLEPSSVYLQRASRCALAGGDVELALGYARKAARAAPGDATVAQALASAQRAAGRFGEAEETLVLALCVEAGDEGLRRAMQADLAEVRRLAATGR